MPTTYSQSDHASWEGAGLKDYGDFADCVEFINQEDDYADSSKGEWWYGDDDTLTIYGGTFGNDHSPGSSHNTYAEVYDTENEYRARVKELESMPEYLPSKDEDSVMMEYEVIVGNIGTVYTGTDENKARAEFNAYVDISKNTNGHRAWGEDVTILGHYESGSDIVEEYTGHLTSSDDPL